MPSEIMFFNYKNDRICDDRRSRKRRLLNSSITFIIITFPFQSTSLSTFHRTLTRCTGIYQRQNSRMPFKAVVPTSSQSIFPMEHCPRRRRREFNFEMLKILPQHSTTSSSLGSSNNAIGEIRREIDDPDDEDDPNNETNSWLRWFMIGAKPRGTNRVIMRDPEELGGVPRGDRYSSRDWLHNTITLPNSAILRNIRSPVLSMTCWATFLSLLHHKLIETQFASVVMHMYIPTTPHSLMMSALGLLLVFRTNSAYQRFAEGRVIWERIINIARDLSRMMMLYNDEIGIDKRRRLQRLLVAFPYLLRHRIRPNSVMRRLDDENYERDPKHTILLYQDSGTTDNDIDAAMLAKVEEETGKSRRKKRSLYWVDKRTLPWRLVHPGALEKLCRAQNRPLWICDRLAQELRNVPDQATFTSRERLSLLKYVDDLSRCIGGAERIHQTMVPLNYARHTLRALTLWLFSLPFALVKDLRLMTGPMIFLVSWLLFGVYEIGYAIEDPFQGTLRLSILCDTVRRDVLGDETIRGSAFQLEISHNGVPIVYDDDDESESSEKKAPSLLTAIPQNNGVNPSSTSDSDAYQ